MLELSFQLQTWPVTVTVQFKRVATLNPFSESPCDNFEHDVLLAFNNILIH